MGNSSDRSKKKIHPWLKSLLHFSLCFIMGFFTGLAPTTTTTSSLSSPQPPAEVGTITFNRSLAETPTGTAPIPTASAPPDSNQNKSELTTKRQLIVITTTKSGDPIQVAFLCRLANTLRMVPPPLLWIVVEAYSDASPRREMILRQSGVMYRVITYKESFTDANAEVYHQRNVALNHVEHHRLNGIVHFASAFNIYQLQFFEEIREIEVFGTWPTAMVSANRKRIVVEGPVCHSSKVVGWQLKDFSNGIMLSTTPTFSSESSNGEVESKTPARINISGFAFNSSILWDPERWGRPSSIPDSSQDSIRFLHQVVLEDETKITAIPSDCSKVMMWNIHLSRPISQ